MKNLIYQYWIGPQMEQCAVHGIEAMRAYAERIGAEYKFDRNPTFFDNICNQPSSFQALAPAFDESFHDYDAVMIIDTDIFPVDGCDENIFEQATGEMNMCQEAHMPALKQSVGTYGMQEQWSQEVERYLDIKMPKNEQGLYKVFNSGLVIYTKEGMKKAKEKFVPIQPFMDHFKSRFSRKLFWRDQAYSHAMFASDYLQTNELDVKWNTQIHYKPNTTGTKRPVIDTRTPDTNFVHVQLSGSGSWDKQMLWEVVNLPVDLWSFR